MQYPDNLDIQYNSLRVLVNATYLKKEMHDAVAAVDGNQAILAALKRFSLDASVQIVGFQA